MNAAVGLIVTMMMFARLTHALDLPYLVARMVASVVAGLAMFVLNATLNFDSL